MTRIRYKQLILALLAVFVLPEGLFAVNNTKKIVVSKYKDDKEKITDYYLHAIYEHDVNNDADATIEYLNKIYAIDSTHAATLYLMSPLAKDVAKQVSLAEKAVKYDPENVDYKFHLSSLYSGQKKYDKSIELIKEIHDKGESNLASYKYLAALYDVVGDVNMAMTTIDSALTKYGQDFDMLSYKAEIFMRQNKTVAYLSTCKDLDMLASDDVETKHRLGLAYAMTGNDSMAYKTFEKAYKIDSTYIPLLSDLASYHEKTRNVKIFDDLELIFKDKSVPFEKKRSYFNDVIRNDFYYGNHVVRVSQLLDTLRKTYDYNYDVESMLSAHFMAIGMTDKAMEVQESFIWDDSVTQANKIQACNTIISTHLYHEDKEQAMKYIIIANDEFCKNREDKDEPLFLAYALGQVGEHGIAIDMLKYQMKSIKDDSLASVYYGTLGDNYYAINNTKKAYQSYDKALQLDPNNTLVLNNYSYYLSVQNTNLSKALDMIKTVLEKEPDNGTYLDTFAWILHLMGKHEQAKTVQLKAIALDNTGSAELFFHYAEILVALGEDLNARRYYRKALEAGMDAEIIEDKLENLK